MKNEDKQFISLLNDYQKLNLSDVINYASLNEALISHHSTAIEGSSLTMEESLLLLTEGLTAKGKSLHDHFMVRDHHNALLWVIEQARLKTEVSSDFLRKLSSIVLKNTGGVINAMAGSYDSSKGDFRKSNVYVGTRYFVNYAKVEREVEKFVDWLNKEIEKNDLSKIDVHNLAFDAHYKLVTIHPFADGNGRTSRLLMNYILARFKLPLAMLFKEDKAEYYKALEECRISSEETTAPIRNFMYQQQKKYLEQEIGKYRKIEHTSKISEKKSDEKKRSRGRRL